jgi:hypothetical protein
MSRQLFVPRGPRRIVFLPVCTLKPLLPLPHPSSHTHASFPAPPRPTGTTPHPRPEGAKQHGPDRFGAGGGGIFGTIGTGRCASGRGGCECLMCIAASWSVCSPVLGWHWFCWHRPLSFVVEDAPHDKWLGMIACPLLHVAAIFCHIIIPPASPPPTFPHPKPHQLALTPHHSLPHQPLTPPPWNTLSSPSSAPRPTRVMTA